ncbi:signal peptide peptidase SppA [Sphingomonas sp.]|uniref:signal peptide peptidase SppA n=1 Tax=Sphingomonas sp. TaxID=28214 RepID=UPI001D7116B9|nr:signal peptide peptidase SppA [Sphingomonas sp.]MBX9797264.1 signal peptide peptidase SppA [Sphingomonas sp.]
MKLLRGAWKLLVGIKDLMVLALMLIFFGALFAALTARPNTASIKDGALVLDLKGSIVEQPRAAEFAFDGQDQPREFRLRDVVRAIDAARDDARVKAVVLDLDSFAGGMPAALNDVGDALDRVRKGGKPVLAYASGYSDSAYRLAAHASEIWMHPMGGALFTGPGGSRLYYKGLFDKLGVNIHVYRVGKFKSFVEPYTRTDQSDEARENAQALYGAIAADWRETVAKARPKAQVAAFLTDPVTPVQAAGGDIAQANLKAGLVDKLGDRTAFNKRVAQIAGAVPDKAGQFRTIAYDAFLAAHPPSTSGEAIGVLTVAGDIVDGKAPAGTAGGDTIARALAKGLDSGKLKALVVRIDSPGGSAMASETIRLAILEAKARKLPVVVSMGGVAASGGYWVATAGDVIFAEPNTITGSIGIFAVLPTFEKALDKIGITSDGVKTTPLSGQPDIAGGTNEAVDKLFQAGIEHGYRQFLERVAQARGKTPAQVDEIAQGRVWDGGSARQIGLVDRFGGLDDAIAEAARRAKLDPGAVYPRYLEKKPDWFAEFIAGLMQRSGDDDATQPGDAYSRLAAERRAIFARALGDAQRLASGAAIQARCLECASLAPAAPQGGDKSLMMLLLARLDW